MRGRNVDKQREKRKGDIIAKKRNCSVTQKENRTDITERRMRGKQQISIRITA
jgi:hypothetical protein